MDEAFGYRESPGNGVTTMSEIRKDKWAETRFSGLGWITPNEDCALETRQTISRPIHETNMLAIRFAMMEL